MIKWQIRCIWTKLKHRWCVGCHMRCSGVSKALIKKKFGENCVDESRSRHRHGHQIVREIEREWICNKFIQLLVTLIYSFGVRFSFVNDIESPSLSAIHINHLLHRNLHSISKWSSSNTLCRVNGFCLLVFLWLNTFDSEKRNSDQNNAFFFKLFSIRKTGVRIKWIYFDTESAIFVLINSKLVSMASRLFS